MMLGSSDPTENAFSVKCVRSRRERAATKRTQAEADHQNINVLFMYSRRFVALEKLKATRLGGLKSLN